jgi:hypothetical protein
MMSFDPGFPVFQGHREANIIIYRFELDKKLFGLDAVLSEENLKIVKDTGRNARRGKKNSQ